MGSRRGQRAGPTACRLARVRDPRARRQGDLPQRNNAVAVRAVRSHVTGLAPRYASAGDAAIARRCGRSAQTPFNSCSLEMTNRHRSRSRHSLFVRKNHQIDRGMIVAFSVDEPADRETMMMIERTGPTCPQCESRDVDVASLDVYRRNCRCRACGYAWIEPGLRPAKDRRKSAQTS